MGKTTLIKTLLRNRKDVLWLNGDESSVRDRLAIQDIQSLRGVIGNYAIVVIDEIQRIQNAGLLLKILADHFTKVQFIATGSSALDISETIFEPLTGRHLLYHLYPFSLAEMYSTKSDFEVEQLLPFHLVYGSYPEVYNNHSEAEFLLNQLTNQYLYKDVLVWRDIRKPELLEKLLKLLAYQVASEVSVHELANLLHVKSETIESYIQLLEKSFVIFRLKSYSTNHRKEVTKMSKVYFWDNGIRNAVIDDFEMWNLRQDQGPLWENFLISERLKMNKWTGSKAKSYFWRNYNQSEVDYLEVESNSMHAFEMKVASKKKNRVSAAFANIYPRATTSVITMQNCATFCRLT